MKVNLMTPPTRLSKMKLSLHPSLKTPRVIHQQTLRRKKKPE